MAGERKARGVPHGSSSSEIVRDTATLFVFSDNFPGE
jgi:hypothetical protein